MPRVNAYLSKDEHEWVKSKGTSYIRSLVQDDMAVSSDDVVPTPKKKEKKPKATIKNLPLSKHAVPGTFCTKHDYPVMKVAGKCPQCGK